MYRTIALVVLALGCKERPERRDRELAIPTTPLVASDAAPGVDATVKSGTGWAIVPVVRGNAHATSLVIDAKGRAVIAIAFEGSIELSDGTKLEGRPQGIVLAAVAPDGTIAWKRTLSDDTTLSDVHVAVDSHDATVIAAGLAGSIAGCPGGAQTSAGSRDIWLAKLAADGTFAWCARHGGSEPDRPAEVVVDASDHIVVAGYYAGSVDFGGRKLPGTNDAEMFVARYAPDGKLVYANRISGGGSTTSELYDVAVDGKGTAVAVGGFGEKLDLGGTPLAGEKGKPLQTYLAAYAATGKLAWSTAYHSGSMTLMNAIEIDHAGRVVLAGSDMNVPVDQNHMTSFEASSGRPVAGSMTTMLASLGPDHKPAWSLPIGGAAMGDTSTIAIADNDDIVIAGDVETAPFGDAQLAQVKTYAARVSAAGKLVWVRAIPKAAGITAYPRVAARGATVVFAAQTGEGADRALVLLRPE
ncbi:MAG TPA: hypothetical protein VFQ53_04750 [Kofleriaceae bacterium]|nr:hypothetical protein [Kofleriaceae bacterium]